MTGQILASLFDQEDFRREVIATVKATAKHAPRIGFPAVLGLSRATEAVEHLEEGLDAEVFEIPTLPPSVPGLRLQNVVRQGITRLGGRVLDNAEAVAVAAAGEGLGVVTQAAARRQRHLGRTAILATGGLLGGGIHGAADGTLIETVAGLGVSGPESRLDWFRREAVGDGGHPVFRAGVRAGADLRAQDPRLPNLFVAGGLLAGADPVRELSLEGVALATGMVAGRTAAQAASTAGVAS